MSYLTPHLLSHLLVHNHWESVFHLYHILSSNEGPCVLHFDAIYMRAHSCGMAANIALLCQNVWLSCMAASKLQI